ncbi:hypothetical protein BAE44_0014459 [Dichanthelium oligosanthes]|uniref:Uncharacterized protein n=1 Tax=Dichanthelium oligosanthes TaxID=888268 RepID=A0A1E5VHD2_9POAL|nr:hypothetical protein BAE44_0014459 [Dichanthelium oligosanthes]
MDRLVRLFSGGIVNDNGEFEMMRQELARFDSPPSFDDIIGRVGTSFKVENEHCELRLRGRFDAGDKRAQYMLMAISCEDDWIFYKECVKGSQLVMPREMA